MKTRKGYLLKRGQTFYAVWQVAGRKFMKTTGQRDKKKAKKELARIMEPFRVEDVVVTLEHVKAKIERSKGQLAVLDDQSNPPMLVNAAWASYLKSTSRPASGPATLKQYESHWDQFLAWATEHHPEASALRDVTRQIASEYASHLLGRGLSGNRFNKHVRFLAQLYRVLADDAKITLNPWSNPKHEAGGKGITRQPAVNQHSRRELTIEELRRVCAAAKGEMRILLGIGIYTGLRLGDCATLRWGEVDLVRGKITRVPNKTARWDTTPVKVDIHGTLRALIEEIPVDAHKVYVLPGIAKEYTENPVALTLRIQKHFRDCGVTTQRPGTGEGTGKRAVVEVGFHSLRHTFVSLLAANRAPLSVAQALVGHSNPAMTLHYTHANDAAALAAVTSLPSLTDAPTRALPPASAARMVDASAMLAIVNHMTKDNWQSKKTELIRLADKAQ